MGSSRSARSCRSPPRPTTPMSPSGAIRPSCRPRARQDAALKIEVRRVFDENFRVYGVRKVWRQLKREGFDVVRCTVSRLMRDLGLRGVIRGKSVKTTISEKAAPCPLDHVNRQPGAIHSISRNSSKTEPAKPLAVFVVDINDNTLTMPIKYTFSFR